MGWLRGKRDDETGEDEGEFARRGPSRGWRDAARKTWREIVRRARHLGPGGHALAAQCRQSSARNRLGAERSGAQSLEGVDDARCGAGGYRENRFVFLRAKFEHINAAALTMQAAGKPVISIDTKKKGVPQRHGRSST